MSETTTIRWEDTVAWSRVVAGCIIQKDGRYLMVQEAQPRAYGLWNLPPGHVDNGESLAAAATREVQEETGYVVVLDEEVGIYHESVEQAVKHVYRAHIIGGQMRPQEDEILDVAWLSFDEIKQLHRDGKIRSQWVWLAISTEEAATTNPDSL